jgi:hypothetical protein
LSQSAYAYSQPQTGYTTQPNESAGSAAAPYDYNTAAVPTSSSAAATTQPAAAPIAQNWKYVLCGLFCAARWGGFSMLEVIPLFYICIFGPCQTIL